MSALGKTGGMPGIIRKRIGDYAGRVCPYTNDVASASGKVVERTARRSKT